MCELNAYLSAGEKEDLYLESVDIIRPENGGVYMRSLFGEERFFQGRIKEIQAIKRKILLEPICPPDL
ncbi:MAG: CooT family nickel-binding protein [Nitrospiraceae bacterium]|nr:CooT family nickel-binding protein [Nitrospiraceae bacterium]